MRVLSFCLFFLGSFINNALAVPAGISVSEKSEVLMTVPDVDFVKLNKKYNKTETLLKNGKVKAAELSEITEETEQIRKEVISAKAYHENELASAERKLDALGEAPADGGNEESSITEKRKEFRAVVAKQKAQIAEGNLLLTRLDEIDNLVINIHNKVLWGALLEKEKPLANPGNFINSSKVFVEFIYATLHSPVDWYEDLSVENKEFVEKMSLPVAASFLLALLVGFYLRIALLKYFGYRKDIEHPRYGRKVFAAVCVAVGYGVIPALTIGGLLMWSIGTNIFTQGYFGTVFNSFLFYLLLVILGSAAFRVIFTPNNEKWRLINMSTQKAKSVANALYFGVYAVGIVSFFTHISAYTDYPPELTSLLTVTSCVVKAFCIALIVKRWVWADVDVNLDEETEENPKADKAFRITFMVAFFMLIIFAISLFGYPLLSSFILERFIFSSLFICALFIARKLISDALHRVLLLSFWVKTFKMRRKVISKINFWLSLVFDPLLILFSGFALLALWGVPKEILKQLIVKIFFGFDVGGVRISLIAIILGIVVFLVGISIVKAIKSKLALNILDKMEIDEGIKHSLEAGFGSVGYVLAALLAIAVMGGNLSSVALIAGALSVGIGLGLQNIVNNFVSGIILLFERPVKVGDWVVIDGQEGVIKQINIRATELQTFQKASVLIPNADLLSNKVTNLTHGKNMARVSLPVGVSYDADPERVRDILLEVAADNKRVLRKPAPYVIFKDFGESSLDFELRCYANNIWNGWDIPSELRYDVFKRFNEEGIEIPFPQRTLHIGDKTAQEFMNKLMQKKATEDDK